MEIPSAKRLKKAFAELFALKDEVERLNLELAGREDYESEAYMKLWIRFMENRCWRYRGRIISTVR